MSAGPWTGKVTRVDGAGRPFVIIDALARGQEYGPLLSVADRVRTRVPTGGGSSAVVEGSVVFEAGDEVLLTDVAGRPSVFVVLGRIG